MSTCWNDFTSHVRMAETAVQVATSLVTTPASLNVRPLTMILVLSLVTMAEVMVSQGNSNCVDSSPVTALAREHDAALELLPHAHTLPLITDSALNITELLAMTFTHSSVLKMVGREEGWLVGCLDGCAEGRRDG